MFAEQTFTRLAILTIVASTLQMGCFHNEVVVGRNYDFTQQEPVEHHSYQSYLFWGFVPLTKAHDVAEICQGGASYTEVEWSFVNGLLNTVTLGIWMTQDVKIFCSPVSP